MKIVFIYLYCFLFCAVVYAQTEITQKLAKVDSVSIARAHNVIEKVLGVKSEDLTCLVFSIDNKVLFIHKTCRIYKLYIFVERYNYDVQKNEFQEMKKQNIKKDKILDSIFNTTIFERLFKYSATDSLSKKYATYDTRYIYFMVSKSGRKICELNLPMSYNVDMSNKECIPIDREVFDYLVEILIGNVSG